VLVAIFFDVEKAYDMMLKRACLSNWIALGDGERVFNWINYFIFGQSIQVREGALCQKVTR
jgi:hypothetical protein